MPWFCSTAMVHGKVRKTGCPRSPTALRLCSNRSTLSWKSTTCSSTLSTRLVRRQALEAAAGLYAEQYYQHVRSFPENLKQLAGRTNGDATLKSIVKENLDEELDASAPHPQLWRQFAQSLGVSDASLEGAQPLTGHCRAAGHVRRSCLPGIQDAGRRRFLRLRGAGSGNRHAKNFWAAPLLWNHRAGRWLILLSTRKRTFVTEPRGANGLRIRTNVDTVGVLCAAERSLKALWGALDAVYPQGCMSKN